jgi:hypothetical protein
MSDIVQTLATHTGLDPALIEKAVGAILGMLKSHLPAETYSQIEEKVPESANLVDAAPPAESSGGILETAGKLAGKLLGKNLEGGAQLIEQLNKLGISAGSLTSLVTQLLKFLSAHLPPEAMAQIVKAFPTIPGLDLNTADLAGETAPAE